MVLPPALAPLHVVIVPFFKTTEDLDSITEYLHNIIAELRTMQLSFTTQTLGAWTIPLVIKFDHDDGKSPGWKFNEYELQ